MDYYNAMDQPKESYAKGLESNTYISDVGAALNPMQHQTEALKARIFEGASVTEFGFMGKGKGNREQFTPESFGSRERQDMRDLAEINEITTTTHASPSAGPLSGFSNRGFNDEQREETLNEINKAIHFAADASTGGAVVVHTGEWQRPISESYGKKGFKGYPEEEIRASILLADKRTGEFITDIRKDEILYEPEYETDKDGNWVDINGKVIPKDADVKRLFQRVPRWNKEGTDFKVKQVEWPELEKRAEQWNKEHPEEPRTPAEMFARIRLENQILQAKGSSLFHAQYYEQHRETRDKAREALEIYKKIEETTDEKEKWRLKRQLESFGEVIDKVVPPDAKYPSEYLKKIIKREEDAMRFIHESSASADAQAKQLQEKLNHLSTVENTGISRTTDTIARAGIYAMEVSKKNKKLKDPLFVAPEAYDPKLYGTHPEEIKKIITESRKDMANKLMGPRYKYSKEKAEEVASKHIKATFDIGHINEWRRYFERKPGENTEQLDKRFNKWVINEAKSLAKEGIIGHIHVSDNFGFSDEHLTPGDGNAPIKEFIKEMKKAGLNKFLVETGSFNPTTALTDTWSFLGSPVYSIGLPGVPHTWTDIRHSYFGRTGRPYNIVGEFGKTISEEYVGSPFYSGLPLE
jgi:sugar phosphate isomerase/epimerase